MYYDEIVEIENIDQTRDLIDIEVSGNHLFFANGILTHNSNSDPGLEDTSESFGLPATADLMLAFVSNEELEQSGQIMVKQLKNRYNDPNRNKRFVVGIDRSKMRLYDAEATDQTLIDDGIPVFDKTPSGDKFKDFKI